MTLIWLKNDNLSAAAHVLGFLFIQGQKDNRFSIYLSRLGKRELIRNGISYCEAM
jgi:hypothetical protein